MQKLDLANFQKSVELFENMISQDVINEKDKLAIIQSFEFAYMQCIKMICKYLKNYNKDYNDQMRLDQAIDIAYKLNLTTKDTIVWDNFRDARNNTSHEYMEYNWDEFYRMAKKFAIEVRYVYNSMISRL